MFFDRIPIESLKTHNLNAMHFGKKFRTAILSAFVHFANPFLPYHCCLIVIPKPLGTTPRIRGAG